MTLTEWAARWGVPDAALTELGRECLSVVVRADKTGSEAHVQSQVRLEAPRVKPPVFLFRNNVGAGKLENGNFVRWGLANDSSRLNEVLKSGDLIGIRRRLILATDVGRYIGQFVSRECKHASWEFTGTMEERAQAAWAALINREGGDAAFTTGPGSL